MEVISRNGCFPLLNRAVLCTHSHPASLQPALSHLPHHFDDACEGKDTKLFSKGRGRIVDRDAGTKVV